MKHSLFRTIYSIKRHKYKDINFDLKNVLWHQTELEKNCLRLRSIVCYRYNSRRNVIKQFFNVYEIRRGPLYLTNPKDLNGSD